MLSGAEIEQFTATGMVVLRAVLPPSVLALCQSELDAELRTAGVDPADPETWTEPVVRFWSPETPAFAAAGTQARLCGVYDQLLGPGRRVERQGLGGSVPVRFPSETDPGDAGWHVDGSFPIGDTWGLNLRSRDRGLLCLFLFSGVGPEDAPTEIKIGSHLHVPPMLEAMGEAGGLFDVQAEPGFPAIEELPSVFATGNAGDVYVCHPFLVHRATWPHRGSGPRFVAQPGVGIHEPFRLIDSDEVYPVERAILLGLGDRSG